MPLLMLFNGLQGEATQFYGIAESQLQTVSFQHPVEIVEIPVVEGKQVGFDTRLLEVRRYDLDVNLQVIDEQIKEIRARQAATRHVVTAEIASLEAELSARLQALSTEIDSLESSHQLNQALLNSISSETVAQDSKPGPMRVKIDGLKAEKRRAGKLFQARIEQQRQKLADLSGPADARVAELEKNRTELHRQSRALVVRSPFAGSVGFKRGEQVAAFVPVISVQGRHPGSVKGYIHDAGYIYLATSVSRNRKGETRPGRRKLLRLQLRQQAITGIEFIDLYQLLQALVDSPQTEHRLRGFLRSGLDAGNIDIESHAVRDKRLYLGFKSPFDFDESSVIVQIDDVDGLFQGHPAQASIWHSFNLGSSTNGKRTGVSIFACAVTETRERPPTSSKSSASAASSAPSIAVSPTKMNGRRSFATRLIELRPIHCKRTGKTRNYSCASRIATR
jgi:hypothetical protein